MNYVQFVKVLYPVYDLLEKPTRFFFFDSLLLHNVVEELSPRSVLHYQVQFSWVLENFIQLDYIGMANKFQDVYFSSYSFNISHVLDLVLLQNLRRHLLRTQLMLS